MVCSATKLNRGIFFFVVCGLPVLGTVKAMNSQHCTASRNGFTVDGNAISKHTLAQCFSCAAVQASTGFATADLCNRVQACHTHSPGHLAKYVTGAIVAEQRQRVSEAQRLRCGVLAVLQGHRLNNGRLLPASNSAKASFSAEK